MTGREQIRLAEIREYLYSKADYKCVACGGDLYRYGNDQLAHRIPKTKHNLKEYGKEIIHHSLNLAPTCSNRCNSAVLIGNKPAEVKALLAEIRAALEEERSHGVQQDLL